MIVKYYNRYIMNINNNIQLPLKDYNESIISYAKRCIALGYNTSTNKIKPSIVFGRSPKTAIHIFNNLNYCNFLQTASGYTIYLYHTQQNEFYYIWNMNDLKYGWDRVNMSTIETLKNELNITDI
jgi:hypothetical protein